MGNVQGVRGVSVPIRGLFYLTSGWVLRSLKIEYWTGFRPHQGIILFNCNVDESTGVVTVTISFRPHQGIILFNPVFETTDIY